MALQLWKKALLAINGQVGSLQHSRCSQFRFLGRFFASDVESKFVTSESASMLPGRQLLLHRWKGSAPYRFYSTAGSASQTALIRQLRERTSAPMKDVKDALVQCQWDQEAAFTALRKRGLAAASKKASRVAAEGLLALAEKSGAAAIVEINSETDFVARNDIFQHLALHVARAALSLDTSSTPSQPTTINIQDLEAAKIVLEHPKLNGEATVYDAIREAAVVMGENLMLRRGYQLRTSSGVVSSYLHMNQQAGLARTAGLITLETQEGSPQIPLEALSREGASLAMHVVAACPLFLSKDHATPEILERERDIYLSQAASSNKPEAVIEKMVEGRLQKYIEDVALLEQKFVLNEKINVRMVLDNLSKEIGLPINVGCFLRLQVGEGIEREEKSFAAEVAASVA
eukprot:c20742_g1_i1 orf=152-1360(+)